ncbi:20840_t:CDS:2, partial [Gigaspora rosea]
SYEPNTDKSDQEETRTLIPNTSISLEKHYAFNNKKGSNQVNIYTLTPYTSTSNVCAIVSYALEVYVLYEPNADEFDQINAYTSISYASTLSGDYVLDELELNQDDAISYDSISSDSSNIQDECDQGKPYTSILYASTSSNIHIVLCESNMVEFDKENAYTPYASISSKIYFIPNESYMNDKNVQDSSILHAPTSSEVQ